MTPEHQTARRELRALLEAAIDRLPDTRRTVFVMRDVEGLSGLETAECLGLTEIAVRVQLHRARSQLRELLFDEAGAATAQAYAFAGDRCDRIVAGVLERIALTGSGAE